MKTASIYQVNHKGYIIYGHKKTVNGLKIASEPYFNLPDSQANPDIIGNAIKASLYNDDEVKAPNPKDWKQVERDLLKNVGLKSIKELESHSNKYVSIKEDGQNITFTPSRPSDKPDKGFLNKDKSEAVSIACQATNQEIGEALN